MTEGGPNERLQAAFRGELQDHMRSVEADLLALERATKVAERAALCVSIFRSVHSLKGAARVVGETALELLCHRLEERLQGLRDGQVAPSPELLQTLLHAVDAIRATADGSDESKANLSAVIVRLEAPGEETSSPRPTTGSAEPPAGRPANEGFVRVTPSQLDELLSRSEELLVARRRAAHQDERLAALYDNLVAEQRRWSDIARGFDVELARDRAGSSPGDPEAESRVHATLRALADYQARHRRLAEYLRGFAAELAADRRALDQAADSLDAGIRRLRMFPFAAACEGLQRAARDLASPDGKAVEVVIAGAEVELDRAVLEALRDPLLHLVRNAVDHGVESEEARRQAGKPPSATVAVSARLRGMQVEVEVADDGRGVDSEAVLAASKAHGQSGDLDLATPLDLIFEPGVSTAPKVTAVSGRGVGLDVVKSRVESMGGTVEVRSQPGRGAAFRLVLPLTLSAVRGVLVSAGGQVFAVGAAFVEQLLRIDPTVIRSVEGRPVLDHRGEPVAFATLAALLAPGADAPLLTGRIPALLLSAGGRRVAIAVDELLAEQDIVVRNLGRRLKRVPYAAGATTLSDGRIALILNVPDLLDSALSAPARASAPAPSVDGSTAPRLLLADDSVTTRTLMTTILEGAGHQVTAVVDGAAAWRELQASSYDLVVSDVEMPHMDGIALTEAIRAAPRLRDLPVVLVTALDSEAARARGLHAGASAYLVKSAFDQRELLEVVRQLL
jgi:two-component system chemotaxis sensor kinase CheA